MFPYHKPYGLGVMMFDLRMQTISISESNTGPAVRILSLQALQKKIVPTKNVILFYIIFITKCIA